jgi:hypothetical protein
MLCSGNVRSSAGWLRDLGLLVCTALLVACVGDAASAAGAPVCKPALAFEDVRFSAVNAETMTRTWTATVVADASRCASSAGYFEILFTRQKENGLEVDFTEPFEWQPGAVQVSVDFWADEAVEDHRATRIIECPCRR